MTTSQLRNSVNRTSLRPGFFLIPRSLMLACFAFMPMAQAVGPDTDGAIAGSSNGEGIGVLVSRTTGVWNTGTGFEALNQLTSGNQNTATGLRALFSDTNGGFNTATGVYALYGNITGWYNNAAGAYALANNTEGFYNSANGYGALYYNTEGDSNTATGFAALFKNTDGVANTANGYLALNSNTTGDANTASGAFALENNTTGTLNTALGFTAGSGVTTASGVIAIGAPGGNVNNTCYIGNIFGKTSAGATAVVVNAAGKLGTIVSSRRFKDDIKPMDQASETLFALKPVSFHYKKEIDPEGVPQFGLVAEDVEKVSPDLVVRDAEGKVNTVRYEAVNAMLLNEFLKEHSKVEKLEAAVASLAATVKTQTAQTKR